MKEIIQVFVVVAVCLIPNSFGEVTNALQTPLCHLSAPASCNNRECDQRCRRLGFTGGACVNGNCKCDSNFSAQNAFVDSDNKLSDDVARASCNNQECDQRCRRLGFTGGACVNGNCKCDINFSAQEALLHSDRASCNNRECDQRCRRLGFTGGVCVDGNCKCDINFSAQEGLVNSDNKLSHHVVRASCNNRECNLRCRRFGFIGGICVNGKCKCDNKLSDDVPRASCNNRECDQRCRRLGFTGGVCVNGNCKCDINFSAPDALIVSDNKLSDDVSRASCNNQECDQRCRRLGFTGGVCVNGNCKCDINFSAQEALVDSDNKLSDDIARASCNNRECDQRCRRLGFTGGVCVSGRCKCDINFSAQEAITESDKSFKLQHHQINRASCINQECGKRCRTLGFAGGVCVNNRCKCNFGLKSLQQSVNDPSSNQADASSCVNKFCNQLCRKLDFKNGVCVNGKCKCDFEEREAENKLEPPVSS